MTQGEDPRGDLRWGSIPGLAADAAKRFGPAEAVADGTTRLTFGDLENEVAGADSSFTRDASTSGRIRAAPELVAPTRRTVRHRLVQRSPGCRRTVRHAQGKPSAHGGEIAAGSAHLAIARCG